MSETERIRREQAQLEIEMDKEFGGGHLRKDRCEHCKGHGFIIGGGFGPSDCPHCDGTGREWGTGWSK